MLIINGLVVNDRLNGENLQNIVEGALPLAQRSGLRANCCYVLEILELFFATKCHTWQEMVRVAKRTKTWKCSAIRATCVYRHVACGSFHVGGVVAVL